MNKEHKKEKNFCCRTSAWPWILIFVGVLFLLQNLKIIDNAIGTYWPVILILIGGVMVFNAYNK